VKRDDARRLGHDQATILGPDLGGNAPGRGKLRVEKNAA
jgi:hypothetical protein